MDIVPRTKISKLYNMDIFLYEVSIWFSESVFLFNLEKHCVWPVSLYPIQLGEMLWTAPQEHGFPFILIDRALVSKS